MSTERTHETDANASVITNQLLASAGSERKLVNLSEEEELALAPFEFAQESVEVEVHEGENVYVVECKRATRDMHSKREYVGRTVKRTQPKNKDGEQIITMVQNTDKGSFVFARLITQRVKGYDEDPETWLDAKQILDETDPKRPVRVIDEIPAAHLLRVADEYMGGIYHVVKPKGRRIITKNVRREWEVVLQTGVRTLEDGTRSKPTHVVRFFFGEALAEGLNTFDASAIQGSTIVEDGGTVREERWASVDTLAQLFDEDIKRIAGGTVNGETFTPDNKKHLRSIDDGIKKTVALLYYNASKVESGN